MKNLTRVLALVLVFSLMVSSVAFAAKFTDVEEGSTYAEATDVLSALGIVNGDPEGTYRPNDDITRAEVVAIANRLQGLSEAAKAAGGVTAYTDVAADAWYAGDVNLATQMGIVSGDGDGTFRPNDNVKYEEAVKIMVTTLGYDAKYADKQGGWPTGYLVIANNAGVTAGVSTTSGTLATRGIVAKLAYNALTAPMMAFKQYSDSGEAIYAPQKAKTLLGEKLGYVKIDGNVTATPATNLTSTAGTDDGFVRVGYSRETATDGTNGSFYKYVTGKTELLDLDGEEILAIGSSDVASSLGYTAAIYVGENEDGDNEVLVSVLSAKKNATVELNPEFIQVPGDTYPSVLDGSAPYISVFDEDVDATNTEYALETTATVIVNNQYNGLASALETKAMYTVSTSNATDPINADLGYIYAPTNGKVELLDSNNNGKYDYIFVTAYETFVVDEVLSTTQSKKINLKEGLAINLTQAIEGKEGYSYSITKNGEAIAITDLNEYDVLSVASTKDKKHIDILVSDAKVTGTVTSAFKPSAGTVDDYVWVIDDTEYKVANFMNRNVAAGNNVKGIDAGDEGTVYIDAFGNIAYFEGTSAVAGDFGFIVAAGTYTSMSKTNYEVKILNKDGSVATYTLAEEVDNIHGEDGIGGNDTDDDTPLNVYNDMLALALYTTGDVNPTWAFQNDEDYYNIPEATAGDQAVDVIDNLTGAAGADGIADALVYDATSGDISALTDIYAQRIITYKVNSNGKITSVTFAETDPTGDADQGLYHFSTLANSTTSKYYASTNTFGNHLGITDSTIVFNLPITGNSVEDDFEISAVSTLVNEKQYDVAFLQVDDETSDTGVLVLTNADTQPGETDALAVITRVMTTRVDNNLVYEITFLQNGESYTYKTTEDVYQNNANLKAGEVFEYSLDAKNQINEINFARTGAVLSPSTILHATADNTYDPNQTADYAYGFVVVKNGKKISLQNSTNVAVTVGAAPHNIDGANVYMIDLTKTNIAPVVSSAGEITETKVDGGVIYSTDNDTYAVIKYVKGEAKDVIIYKGFARANIIAQPSISLDNATLTLAAAASQQLTATVAPVTSPVTWTTSNAAVATVAADGTVTVTATATTGETATITAKIDVDGVIYTATCVVTVA